MPRKKNTASVQAAAVKKAPVNEQKAPIVTPEEKAAVTASNTVMVALNRTSGILFDVPGGRRVLIHGNAENLRGKEKGILPIGAFGLTQVDAADWAYIEKTYHGMEIFKNGLIFAQKSKGDAMAAADERKDTRNGLEPVDIDSANTAPLEMSGAL